MTIKYNRRRIVIRDYVVSYHTPHYVIALDFRTTGLPIVGCWKLA